MSKTLALLLIYTIFVSVSGVVIRQQEGCISKSFSPLDIKVEDYKGRWYEIYLTHNARESFEKNCECVYAQYGIINPKYISVDNSCWKSNQYRRSLSQGSAKNWGVGSFDVSFFSGQFWKTPYQVVYMEGIYQFVIVVSCTPYRDSPFFQKFADDFIWILSRTPELTDDQVERAFQYLRTHNFDSNSLFKTEQSSETCQKFHNGEL